MLSVVCRSFIALLRWAGAARDAKLRRNGFVLLLATAAALLSVAVKPGVMNMTPDEEHQSTPEMTLDGLARRTSIGKF